VLALDRNTGVEMWRADLKGSDFVNVIVDGDGILAATKGEIFCLDCVTGRTIWRNELRGLGRGLITVATGRSPLASFLPLAEKRRRDEEAAAAASAATISTSS